MVYSKEVEDHTAALKLERKIKSMKSRKYIETLIKKDNEVGRDFYIRITDGVE